MVQPDARTETAPFVGSLNGQSFENMTAVNDQLKLTAERREILSKQTFLFDCDGTLYNGKEVIPGARELIMQLRAAGKEIFFFTNNSSRDRDAAFIKLQRMGLAERVDEVIMSTDTVIYYLNQHSIKDIFLLGTASMRNMLEVEGITDWGSRGAVSEALASTKDFDAAPKTIIADLKEQVSRVVVAFDREMTFAKYAVAIQLVQAGVPYVQAHPDLFCPTDKGPEADCGLFAMGIEAITKTPPEVVLGKPHPLMIAEVEKRTSVPREQMIIFGDRLHVDVEMGRLNGIDTAFVLTGDSQLGDIGEFNRPRYTLSSVADLI